MGTKVKIITISAFFELSCPSSPHPYIFFNQDHMSFSFVGFKANRQTGDLINPADGSIIEKAMISPQLITGLEQNRVNFNEDYTVWSK